jgi:hypothetical protein
MTPPDYGHLSLVSTDHLTPTTVPDPLETRRVDSQLRRLSRQTMGMAGLLERRPELRGVATWSEGVVESVLWSA